MPPMVPLSIAVAMRGPASVHQAQNRSKFG
jgi:hypothetical protein